MRYSPLFLILLIFACGPKHDVPITIEIHSNWEFRNVEDTVWHSANVPGNVFSDLLDNGLIEDPFIGNNEQQVQWVSETDWEYRTRFSLDEEALAHKHFQLNFEGLDTYASAYLNDSLILNSNNAFREWNVNIKRLLKPENELRILFERPSKFEAIEKAKLPYELPVGNRIFTRKAQFQYGWDWGPVLNTAGIWKPIKLTSWNDYKIEDVYLRDMQIDETNASFIIEISSVSGIEENLNYDIYVNDSIYAEYEEFPKANPENFNVVIENPKLWWPHNLGDPHLYDIKVIVKEGQRILDSALIQKGLRTINLVAEKDSIGQSFYFKVNGEPVFAKGANYIPQHSFQNKVSREDYDRLLNDVVKSNINMLRVWGGGIYEDDYFYKLCDEKGVLAWQDFMFACAMYPGDTDFLNNVKVEAQEQVKRLRNHASLALWCGNNENSEAWHRWGWQEGRSEAEKEEIWNNYLKLFDSLLPQIVNKYSDTDYWESSPKYGRGNPKYKTEGDAHDWWIWHDAYPFEHLEENVPRFMSEFGFQSFPSYEVIRYINQNDSIVIDSEEFINHQKHPRGFHLIEDYMQRDYPIPDKAEDYVYMSQLLQARGMSMGIRAQRRAKPYNMGTLYWQLNDCWPVVSWSSMDYFGNWKAMQYQMAHDFKNVIVSSHIENDTLNVYVVNDNLESVEDNLRVSIQDFDNKVLWKDSKQITVKPNSSEIKYQLPLAEVRFPKDEIYFDARFNYVDEHFFFVKPKDLKLKQGKFETQWVKMENGIKVIISSDTYQKDVFLSTKYKGWFHENFFDLYPGQRRWVYFLSDDPRLKEQKTIDDLKIISFNNFIR
ncbi:beta-mannosidase [Winogradskyella alexanderae]|uniref:Beta-mannosidase B n=1 Tax=Winogradskyella alexanderae TaxID=2877123 RepID=A0ABS7XNC7_9FLAO|nr:glycoside hydrolase family 2 protein [Winogradskyella alexanderae]MCA0130994.1 glycoside hydrolase family 2 protein [Winogradskyella alexanderae]